MIVNVTCPQCGALLDATPEWLGQQIECGGCASVFVCPEIAEEAPPDGAPKLLKEKKSRRERDRDHEDEDDERWDGYAAYSQDDDPDSYISKQRGPGFATTSMVLGIVSLALGTIITFCSVGFGGFIQIIISLVGLIFGYFGIRSDARGNAIAGMVMNVLGALIAVAFMAFTGYCVTMNPFRPAPPTGTGPGYTTTTFKSQPTVKLK